MPDPVQTRPSGRRSTDGLLSTLAEISQRPLDSFNSNKRVYHSIQNNSKIHIESQKDKTPSAGPPCPSGRGRSYIREKKQ